MPRATWPPRYVNSPIGILRDEQVSNAAYRFYNKLRALAWGEASLSIEMSKLFSETGLGQSQVYEYARLLRDRGGLLFRCADGVFECSFPDVVSLPDIPEMPTLSLSKTKNKNPAERGRSGKTGSATPPAIAVFRSIAQRFPDKAVWVKIVAAVGEKPADLERWQRTIEGWIAAGHYKLNVAGMLDWFAQGRTSKVAPDRPDQNSSPFRLPEGV